MHGRRLILGVAVTAVLSAGLLPATSQAAAETVTVKLTPGHIVANGSSTSTVTAVVTSAGVVVTGHTIRFTASDSAVHFSATTEKTNGDYVATLTSSTVAGTVIVSAIDESAAQPAAGEATLTQTAGAAKTMTLSVSPTSIVADGNSYTTATATLADAHGNPVTGATVGFSSSDPGEKVQAVTSGGNGTYSALIKSSTTPGQITITATDSAAKLSAVASLTQTLSGSNLSLAAFPSAAVTNQNVTLLAAVTSNPGFPSGTVTFANGGSPIAGCVAVPITALTPAVTCNTSFAASTSPELLTADFEPDAASGVGSAIGSATVTVAPDSTSTSVDASKTTGVGDTTTYTATVQPPMDRPGPIEPTGTVEFLDGGQPIHSCLNQSLTAGGAVCTVTYGSAGTHTVSARYNGDPNFNGSTSTPETVSVVPLPPDVAGIIASTMQWTFSFTPSYTKVLALVVNGLAPQATVSVTCHGHGCPRAKRLGTTAKAKRCQTTGPNNGCAGLRTVDLTAAFRNRLLRAGTRIAVTITRPGWIGKSYTFVARAGRRPLIEIACLAPGAMRPGAGC
ncbi:MAG TPA: invasin domain 3-containing protein [Solirubrobacteraceae bacterium]|nr:invasin domain 3-containing protein [Solirubrobacteraceae bacterium]